MNNKLREEVRQVRSQLEAEKKNWDELRDELDDTEESLEKVRSENSELKQKLAAARKLPDAATILSQLRTRRKKSRTDLGDLEAILELLEPGTVQIANNLGY